MNVYIEMAKRLAQEISATQRHLEQLHAALSAIEPLLTVDVSVTSERPRLSVSSSAAMDVEQLDAVRMDDAAAGIAAPNSHEPVAAKSSEGSSKTKGGPSHSLDGQAAPTEAKRGRPRKTHKPEDSAEPLANAEAEAAKATETRSIPSKTTGRPRSSVSSDIPATSKTFWLQVMGRRKQSISQIADRAIQKLGVSEDARPVLVNRLSAWLYPAIKSGALQAVGTKGKYKLYQVVSG